MNSFSLLKALRPTDECYPDVFRKVCRDAVGQYQHISTVQGSVFARCFEDTIRRIETGKCTKVHLLDTYRACQRKAMKHTLKGEKNLHILGASVFKLLLEVEKLEYWFAFTLFSYIYESIVEHKIKLDELN